MAVAALLAFSPETSEDVFWHLKTGQVILAGRHLVTTNIFSTIFPGYPWHDYEWLFQVLLAAIHGAAGWRGITVVKTLLACLLGGLLYAVLMGRVRRPLPASLLAAGVVALVRFRLTPRPHLVSYVLFMVLILLVDNHRRRGGKLIWALPLLFAFWSNVHPEFLLGFAWLLSALAGRWLDRRWNHGGPDDLRPLLAVTILCLPATLLNPLGYRALLGPFSILAGVNNFSPGIFVSEFGWSSPAAATGFWVALALALAAALLTGRRRWADLLPAAWTAVLAVRYFRCIPYFLFTAAPLVQRRLADLPRPASKALRRWPEACLGILAAAALCWSLFSGRAAGTRLGWGLDESDYPAAAADALLSRPFPAQLYNNYDVGGYLIWRLYPAMGVFQDGGTAYPGDFYKRVMSTGPGGWSRLFDDYGVNTVLVDRQGQELHGVREGWALVFWDQGWMIFVRRSAEKAENLERYEYRIFLPGVDPAEVKDRELLPLLVDEMRRNQKERRKPSAPLARATGEVLLRLGLKEEAAAAFREAEHLGPGR
jgi:hypothetical protein